MSDFDVFLEGMRNLKFIEQSILYYDDKFTCLEIEDNEAGLTGEFSESDVRNLFEPYKTLTRIEPLNTELDSSLLDAPIDLRKKAL